MNLLQRHHLARQGIRPSEKREKVWGPTAGEWSLMAVFAIIVTFCFPWWTELGWKRQGEQESEADLQRRARAVKAQHDAEQTRDGKTA